MDEEFMMMTQASSASYTTMLKELVETIDLANKLVLQGAAKDPIVKSLLNLLIVEIDLQTKYQSDCVVAYNDAKAKEKKATVTAIK